MQKSVKVDLFTKRELKSVKYFVDHDDNKGLRDFLNEPKRKSALYKKGVVADYLYYNLQFRKKEIKKMKLVS
jgi:hypothetical protein